MNTFFSFYTIWERRCGMSRISSILRDPNEFYENLRLLFDDNAVKIITTPVYHNYRYVDGMFMFVWVWKYHTHNWYYEYTFTNTPLNYGIKHIWRPSPIIKPNLIELIREWEYG